MPTFVFFQYAKEVARLQGATKEPIEQTIKKFYKDSPSKDLGYVRVTTAFVQCVVMPMDSSLQTDLKPFIEEKSCTALNEIDKWQNAILGSQPGMFRSDEDDPEVKWRSSHRTRIHRFYSGQLILHLSFNQIVKVHSIAIEAPEGEHNSFLPMVSTCVSSRTMVRKLWNYSSIGRPLILMMLKKVKPPKYSSTFSRPSLLSISSCSLSLDLRRSISQKEYPLSYDMSNFKTFNRFQ